MTEILVGTAGNILGNLQDSIKELPHQGLKVMEVEFVRNIYLSNAQAREAGELAKKLGIKLSIHCPYFINLASKEKVKIEASKKRIFDSCERGHHLGAKHIVFHPAFYQGREPKIVYEMVKEAMLDVMDFVKQKKWNVLLSPETTGKVSSFGTEDELLQLMDDTGCSVCIDFAHIWARNQGKIDYGAVLDKFRKLKHIHCHFSGIEFGPKGERRHIPIGNHPPFKPLVEELLKKKQNATFICEAIDPLQDALKMKKIIEQVQGKPL